MGMFDSFYDKESIKCPNPECAEILGPEWQTKSLLKAMIAFRLGEKVSFVSNHKNGFPFKLDAESVGVYVYDDCENCGMVGRYARIVDGVFIGFDSDFVFERNKINIQKRRG